MHQLPLFLSLGGKPVLVVGDGPAAEAKRRLVGEAGGVALGAGDALEGVRIAFVAVEGPEAAEIAGGLRQRGLLVNVVDQPALCDFTVPAIIDRSPVLVAVGTGGASASLAKALKERLDILLPAGVGRLAEAIHAARRAVAARHATVPARRAFWSAALAPGGMLDPLVPHEQPDHDVADALAGEHAPEARTAIVTVGPDGAEGLTLRDLRLLAAADLVIVGAGIDDAVMALVRRDADRLSGDAVPDGATGRLVLLRTGGDAPKENVR